MSVANLVRDRDPPPLNLSLDHKATTPVSPASTALPRPLPHPTRSLLSAVVPRAHPDPPCHERHPRPGAHRLADDDAPPRNDTRPHSDVVVDVKQYAKLLTPFIYKLYCLVADASTNYLCEWANGGNAFIVHHPTTFSAEVLPQYFKHNQFSSFVRQLNKYSFHKLAPGSYIFGHTHFVKGRADLLLHIGPPRSQERNGEKGHQAPAGGGASLSSLQRDTTAPKFQLDLAHTSQIALPASEASDASGTPLRKTTHSLHSDPTCERLTAAKHRCPSDHKNEPAASLQCPRALSGTPVYSVSLRHESMTTGHTDALEDDKRRRNDMEDIVQRVQQRLALEFSRDLSIAKSERDELLHRLCAVERRNDDLERELLDCYQRIEALEHCNDQSIGLRRLRVEVKEPALSDRKRLRGNAVEDPVTVRSGR